MKNGERIDPSPSSSLLCHSFNPIKDLVLYVQSFVLKLQTASETYKFELKKLLKCF